MQVRMRERAIWHDGGTAVWLEAGQAYDLPVVVARGLVSASQAEPIHAAPVSVATARVPETGHRRRRR